MGLQIWLQGKKINFGQPTSGHELAMWAHDYGSEPGVSFGFLDRGWLGPQDMYRWTDLETI